jgi:4-hydroxy 2-oxovalerate aldolase
MSITLIDCTFRDGGYYNNWDFPPELVREYLLACDASGVDIVELGFRSFDRNGFRGPFAYTTDAYLRRLSIPARLKVGVMVNAAELIRYPRGPVEAASAMFAEAATSPVDVVRIACHIHEFEAALPAAARLKQLGYTVGVNLMQIADRSESEIEKLGKSAAPFDIDALYFADSIGSLEPEQVARIALALRRNWPGKIGIHTHDNMGRALANTLRAIQEGVTWVDSTVSGMGRGPGNAQTEYLAIEVHRLTGRNLNLSPLLALIRDHFAPMRRKYGWGTNPYYYLAGQYGIHPTFIQEMLADARYGEAEILSVIEHLRQVGGKKYSSEVLDAGRQLYGGATHGDWAPAKVIRGREVLILGSGPSVQTHRAGIEEWIASRSPFVIALNTQTNIASELIDVRAACHPFRLLADCGVYSSLPQPLVAPSSRISGTVREALASVKILDFGISVAPGQFDFHECFAVVPCSLVIAYALAIATSGQAARVALAGFDGYGADDPRSIEMDALLDLYRSTSGALPLEAITPTRYRIPATSVYAL